MTLIRGWIAASLLAVACLGCEANTEGRLLPTDTAGELVASEPLAEPELADFAVWRPFFFTSVGDHKIDEIVGTAFAVRIRDGDQPYLLTTSHLLGPETGLDHLIEPSKIREQVNHVVASEAFGATDSFIDLALPLDLPVDLETDNQGRATDVLLIPGGPGAKRLRPISLAEGAPEVGDSIWLGTAVFGGAPASQKVHQAEVFVIRDGTVSYRFHNPLLDLKAAAGAPLLDRNGRIVGMHLKGSADNDEVSGSGIDVDSLRSQFAQFLGGAVLEL